MAPVVNVLGIDPGSEKWAVAELLLQRDGDRWVRTSGRGLLGEASGRPAYASVRDLFPRLIRFAEQVEAGAGVLMTLDCPLRFPQSFGHWLVARKYQPRHFPFDVNPFATRPCDRLLGARPKRQSQLACPKLSEYAGSLMPDPLGVNHGPRRHEGCNVLGFSGVTHWAVVRAVLGDISRSGLAINSNPDAVTPWLGRMTALESHPAVTMALLCQNGRLDGVDNLKPYKDGTQKEARQTLWTAISSYMLDRWPHLLFRNDFAQVATCPTDDELDALVGLLNALDVLHAQADWIGDDEDGYIVVPRLTEHQSWREHYADAKVRIRASPLSEPRRRTGFPR